MPDNLKAVTMYESVVGYYASSDGQIFSELRVIRGERRAGVRS